MNPIREIQCHIRQAVLQAAQTCREAGHFSFEEIPDFVVEVPNQSEHGDFACNLAMLFAKQARMSPRKIAEYLVQELSSLLSGSVEKIDVAGAGFINFYLPSSWLENLPAQILACGENYGKNEPRPEKIQVEFVSANPTGNLHMGNARGGALGDSLANLLRFDGYQVEKEYYINDAGNQITVLGQSLEMRYKELLGEPFEFPENGYAGQDIVDTVQHIIQTHGREFLSLPPEEMREKLTKIALKEKLTYIKQTLADFGISYDCWFSESSLHTSGKVKETVEVLRQRGYVYESEGALWLKATAFGEEKDEVLIRANGIPTYFASDIAYHCNKFERGFDRIINIWGADHHGHVARMKNAMAAIGYDPERLTILLIQLVRLYRGGEIVRMSKRTGTTVSLDELIEEVGRDAARFFFIMRSPDSHLDFDLELARKQSQENPVYYVQYAHARICSIFRQAAAAGAEIPSPENVRFAVLDEEERALLHKVVEFPEEIRTAAEALAPHRIARYLQELAGSFHSFYNHHRVLSDQKELQDARLVLLACVRVTLKNALEILGVRAPEHM